MVDVREQHEWNAGHVAGATLIPLSQLPARFAAELRTSTRRSCCTATPARAGSSGAFLAQQGYRDLVNMVGSSTLAAARRPS